MLPFIFLGISALEPSAEACSMAYLPPNLTLPASIGSPDSVFTAGEPLDENGEPLSGETLNIDVGNHQIPIFIPDERLDPGTYSLSSGGEISIEADLDEAGEPPSLIELERERVLSGRWANCGPRVKVTNAVLGTDNPNIVLSYDPVGDTIFNADLLTAEYIETEDGRFYYETDESETIYAASVYSDGSLSEWSDAIDVDVRGCQVAPLRATGWMTLLIGFAAVIRRRNQPSQESFAHFQA